MHPVDGDVMEQQYHYHRVGVISKAPKKLRQKNPFTKLSNWCLLAKKKNRKPGYEPFLQTVVKQKRFCERQHCSTSAGTSQVGPQ